MRTFSDVRLLVVSLAFFAVFAGCRDEQAGPKHRGSRTPGQQLQPLASVPNAPSDLTFRSGATWNDGALVYVGAKVTPVSVKPGETVTVRHYFLARRPLPSGYQLFVHVVDPFTGQMLMNADHPFAGGRISLDALPVGQLIEDEQSFAAPRANGGQVRVLLGFWQGDSRLKVDQPQAHDGADRMIGPPVRLEDSQPLPEYTVHRTAHPPVIDGDLSDRAWAEATPVTLVGSFDGRPTQTRTTARLLYDDHFLYVAFDAQDPDVWGTLLNRDDAIYNEEAVEVFLDANADGKTYNELEVSPNNTQFDAYFPARRQGMDLSWDSQMRSAVKVQGTLNNPDDVDQGWTVEVAIPFDRLAEVPHLPPQKGDKWRFNLYRLEHLQRRQVEGQAFSPLFQGDFHNLPRFGWLVFG